MNPLNSHPNAAVAGTTTGAGVFVVWLLGYLGVDLSAELGATIAGGAATVLLFVARDGLAGAWRRLLYGTAGKPTRKAAR